MACLVPGVQSVFQGKQTELPRTMPSFQKKNKCVEQGKNYYKEKEHTQPRAVHCSWGAIVFSGEHTEFSRTIPSFQTKNKCIERGTNYF